MHIMVDSHNKKHRNWRYNYHVQEGFLSKGSVQKITENINVVCPELLLIQMSEILPFLHLCLIAYEFCGTYSIDPSTKEFVNKLKPITSRSKVTNYVNRFAKKNKYSHGVRAVKELCKILEDGSASPMESRLYLKLCGSRKLGLYGCKNLKFNQRIEISKEAQKISGQKIIVADIVAPNEKVAIEYNSAKHHEDIVQGQKDQRRRDALVHDGWKVHSFSPAQVFDSETFHIIAIQILKDIDQNYRIRTKNFKEKNRKSFILLR